jgi:hypothetical protein
LTSNNNLNRHGAKPAQTISVDSKQKSQKKHFNNLDLLVTTALTAENIKNEKKSPQTIVIDSSKISRKLDYSSIVVVKPLGDATNTFRDNSLLTNSPGKYKKVNICELPSYLLLISLVQKLLIIRTIKSGHKISVLSTSLDIKTEGGTKDWFVAVRR